MPDGVPPGTLVMLALRVLHNGPLHGYAIAQRIHALSSDVLQVEEGSLYPALYRMEQRGWISSSWGTSENNRRARFYQLTRARRRQLDAETESLVQDAVAAMGRELTLVVVSHRLSAVARADHFVLLEGGRVSAQGERAEIPSLRETILRLYGSRFDEELGARGARASAAGGEA